MDLPVIELEQVSKSFRLPMIHSRTVGNKFTSLLFGERRQSVSQPALREASFSVERGEKIAILGPNGAGKTTLLKIVAGILHPDRGNVIVRGTVAPLLHMGVGFHSDLTGRENVFLSCSLFGLSPRQAAALYDQIVDFAELEDFMDAPVACYSSGMKARLGFAVSSSIDADIYLLDEGLSAGDAGFKAKCKRRIQELLGQDKTWLIATHNSQEVGSRCSRAFLMQRGTLQIRESYEQAYEEYCQLCEEAARGRCGDLVAEAAHLLLPDGSRLRLEEERCRGEVRRVDLDNGRVRFSGWAYDTELEAPAEEFLVFVEDRCVARAPVELERPAVARSLGSGVAALGFVAELEAGRDSSDYQFFVRSGRAACSLGLREAEERQRSSGGSRRRKQHPTIFAVTHWKAGSQWTAQMLRELAPRRAVEANVDTVKLSQPLKQGGLYAPVYLTREAFQRVLLRRHRQHPYRAFFIMRDLRDSLVSFYFSSLYSHRLIDDRMAKRRERLEKLEKEAALLELLEHDFIPFAWVQSSWMGSEEPCFRYEDLLRQPLEVMQQIVDYCELKVRPEQLAEVVERNSFEQRTGRSRGEEDPLQHNRKGVAGDWQNHFTPLVARRFLELYGDVLMETGYEKDRSWIDRMA